MNINAELSYQPSKLNGILYQKIIKDLLISSKSIYNKTIPLVKKEVERLKHLETIGEEKENYIATKEKEINNIIGTKIQNSEIK